MASIHTIRINSHHSQTKLQVVVYCLTSWCKCKIKAYSRGYSAMWNPSVQTLHIKFYLNFRKASNYAEMCAFKLSYTWPSDPPLPTPSVNCSQWLPQCHSLPTKYFRHWIYIATALDHTDPHLLSLFPPASGQPPNNFCGFLYVQAIFFYL